MKRQEAPRHLCHPFAMEVRDPPDLFSRALFLPSPRRPTGASYTAVSLVKGLHAPPAVAPFHLRWRVSLGTALGLRWPNQLCPPEGTGKRGGAAHRPDVPPCPVGPPPSTLLLSAGLREQRCGAWIPGGEGARRCPQPSGGSTARLSDTRGQVLQTWQPPARRK